MTFGGAAIPVLCAVLSSVAAWAQNPNPMDSIRLLPEYRGAAPSVDYLSAARIEKHVPAELRDAWTTYIERSRRQFTIDTAAMNAELRGAGLAAMTRGPYSRGFALDDRMTPEWFASDSARRLADAILSFQAPNGGWSKRIDVTTRPRRPGESYYAESDEWQWISTIDNGGTTSEIRFLAGVERGRHDDRYARAIVRGVDYLLAAQMPNGCYPQVYPLEGSYHDAATFNDNAMANVLALLRDASEARVAGVSDEQRWRAARAVARGVECIVDAQVVVGGKRTAWGQQHDPLTLAAVGARTYELAGLASLESAGVLDFLMSLASPSSRVIDAVHAGASWLAARSIRGFTYENYVLEKHDGAGPIWGRLYEQETNRVIMANRNGVKLYDWNQLTDRRTGYGWYTTVPAETLATFARWSKTHRRPS